MVLYLKLKGKLNAAAVAVAEAVAIKQFPWTFTCQQTLDNNFYRFAHKLALVNERFNLNLNLSFLRYTHAHFMFCCNLYALTKTAWAYNIYRVIECIHTLDTGMDCCRMKIAQSRVFDFAIRSTC